MEQVFERDIKCQSCKGTGLFVGMAERDGWAVVCHKCKGKGHHKHRFVYEEFDGRVPRDNVVQVLEVNPGIVVGLQGSGRMFTHKSFGGMSYEEWAKGESFPQGSENREFCCPASWYQSADYDRRPEWEECIGAGAFSNCSRFRGKVGCWERFDSNDKERAEHGLATLAHTNTVVRGLFAVRTRRDHHDIQRSEDRPDWRAIN